MLHPTTSDSRESPEIQRQTVEGWRKLPSRLGHAGQAAEDDGIFRSLRDVLCLDIPDSAKLFFAKLGTNSGFRAHFGISDPAWEEHPESLKAVALLEQAGFLTVVRDGEAIRYVARRDCDEL